MAAPNWLDEYFAPTGALFRVRIANTSQRVAVGDVVCPASLATAEPTVTRVTKVALDAAGGTAWIALAAGAPGDWIKVAIGGMVSPAITGLPALTGYARVNPDTARVERASASADYLLGTIDGGGWLVIRPVFQKAAFSPRSIANLEVWCAADIGNPSGAVWADLSGNGRNAVPMGGQPPVLEQNALNGKPGLKFRDDVETRLRIADVSSFFPSAASLFVVGMPWGGTPKYGFVETKHDSNGIYCNNGVGSMATFRASPATNYPGTVPTSGAHQFSVRSSADIYEVSIDGTPAAGSPGPSYSPGGIFTIGAQGNNAPARVYIFEFCAYSRVVSGAEKVDVEAYLRTKWGLP